MLQLIFMMKMIKFILVFALTQDMDGKMELKKALNSRFQIQIRGSNILRLSWVKKVLALSRFSIL